MKLYFWDWNRSLSIQRVDMEMPWPNVKEAGMNDCYTSLSVAKTNAIIDLQERISELQKALEAVKATTVDNVQRLEYMRGL